MYLLECLSNYVTTQKELEKQKIFYEVTGTQVKRYSAKWLF